VSEQPLPDQRKGSFLRAIQAVLWSFVGLRSRSEFNKDAAQLNPIHLIAVGLVLGLLFVLGLLALVTWVVSQPVTL
jgi:amino acid transporter